MPRARNASLRVLLLLAGAVCLPGQPPPAAESAPGSGVAQESRRYPPYTPTWYDPEGRALPFQTDEQVIEFLDKARPGRMRGVPEGITAPEKVLLELDGIRMHAIFRHFRQERTVMPLADGSTEINFRDDYIFEPAAYVLSRMLGLNTVPPTTVRRIYGRRGSLQAWVERAMTEKSRRAQDISPPDQEYYNRQYVRMQVFDSLIYNTDRNLGNILLGPDWRLWMIDHTRAFRRHRELFKPELIRQCERRFYEALKALDEAEARQRLRPYLGRGEMDSLLARRKLLIAHIEAQVAERGADRVFYPLD